MPISRELALFLVNTQAQEEEARADWGYVSEDEEYMFDFDYDVSYEVKYNENNQLSILFYDYIYLGGVHGNAGVTSYNFNALTGQQLKLGDVAKSSAGVFTMGETYGFRLG